MVRPWPATAPAAPLPWQLHQADSDHAPPPSSRATRCPRRLLPWVAAATVFAFGALVAVLLTWMLRMSELDGFRSDLVAQCRTKRRALYTALNVRVLHMMHRYAAATYSTSVIDEAFVNQYVLHSTFGDTLGLRVAFGPVVNMTDLPRFEQHYNVTVHQFSNLAENDSISMPVAIGYPPEENARIRGGNRLSVEGLRPALLRAVREHIWTISPTFLLPLAPADGFILSYPVPERPYSEQTPFTQWFVLVAFLPDILVPSTVSLLGRPPQDLHLRIRTRSGGIIYDSPPIPFSHDAVTETLPIGHDEMWDVVCTASRGYRNEYLSGGPWVLLSSVLLLFALIGVLAHRGTVSWQHSKDILDEYHSQEELLDTLSKYSQAIVEAVPDALVVLDIHGRILAINQAGLKLAGYKFVDIEGKSIEMLLTIPDAQRPIVPSERSSFRTNQQRPSTRRSSISSSTTRSVGPLPQRLDQVDLLDPTEPQPNSRQTTFGSQFYLLEGAFDTQIMRRDGTTLMVQVSVSNNPDFVHIDGLPIECLNIAAAATGQFADFDSGHQVFLERVSQSFAQIVLFHDITPQVASMKAVAVAKSLTIAAQQDRRDILDLTPTSLHAPITEITRALNEIQCHASNLPPSIRNDAFSDAPMCLAHITNILTDIGLYRGKGLLFHSEMDDQILANLPCTCRVIVNSALDSVLGLVQDKALRVYISADQNDPLPLSMVRAELLVHVMRKLVVVTVTMAHIKATYRLDAALHTAAESTRSSFQSSSMRRRYCSHTRMHVRIAVSALDPQFPVFDADADLTHALSISTGGAACMGSMFTHNVALSFFAIEAAVKQLPGGELTRFEWSPTGEWVVNLVFPIE